jgi:Sulfotransferase domain
MVSPIIICDGIIRSGSTWSFNVCRLLGQMLSKRRGQPFGIGCVGEDSLDHFLQVEAGLRDGAAVIKVHEVGPVALEWIRTGRVKAVCTFRDPRDCVASDIVFWGDGFDPSVRRVARSLEYLYKSYQHFDRTLFVRYEEMIEKPLWQIRRIAEYLQIPIDQKQLEWIDGQTNIHASRKICEGLSARPEDQVDIGLGNHRRDRVSLLHDNHIGSAKSGRWKTDLTAEQGQMLTQIFRPGLEALGYESSGRMSHPGGEADVKSGPFA